MILVREPVLAVLKIVVRSVLVLPSLPPNMRTYAIRALALALLSVGFFPGTTTDARKNPPKPAPAQHVNALYYVNW